MIFPSNRVRILVATKPIDFRKGASMAFMMSSKLNELIITNNVTANSMISIEISIRMIFFRLRTNPRIPIKNSTRDRFMI